MELRGERFRGRDRTLEQRVRLADVGPVRGRPVWRRLQRYLERGRPREAQSDRIFLSLRRDRRTGDYEPLTKSGAEQLVRTLGEQAGIQKRVFPHMLRHSYATWALNRGMNPILLAQVLGHSSLVMIQRNYAHSTPADAHELMAKLLAET